MTRFEELHLKLVRAQIAETEAAKAVDEADKAFAKARDVVAAVKAELNEYVREYHHQLYQQETLNALAPS